MVKHAPNSPRSVSVEEHLARILDAVSALAPREVALAEAHRLVLAADVVARVDVPGFDNSSMDGYAVRRADVSTASDKTPVTLTVVADVPAGSKLDPPLGPGEAARIMTGAPLPSDADAIVPVEDVTGGIEHGLTAEPPATIEVLQAPSEAAFVRRTGSDVRVGDTVLTEQRVLGARDLAAAASAGVSHVLVRPAPRVGVLSTGSELRPAGSPLQRGEIHDSNSVLLTALITEAGGVPVPLGVVPDDEDAFRALLTDAAPRVDAIVTSGGVSVGAFDIVKAVLARDGVWFGPVRMQPGKPQGFGAWAGAAADDASAGDTAGAGAHPSPFIFALPGNPVSVFVSFEQFVRPALHVMGGRDDWARETVTATAIESWSCPPGRRQFLPAILDTSTDAATVRPASAGGSGSHLGASLAAANALVVVPETIDKVRAGDRVDVTLIP